MFRMSVVSAVPSTKMWPSSCASSLLMQRIRVDLPDPEGPITTTTSLRPTCMFMFFSASKSLKRLKTPSITIMASSDSRPPDILDASLNTSLLIEYQLLVSFRFFGFLCSSRMIQPRKVVPQTLGIHRSGLGRGNHPV